MEGGGGGGVGEVGLCLSQGAVAALSPELGAEGMRPVLQLADAPRPLAGSMAPPQYFLALSDGAHLLPGVLASPLNHLVAAGALRRSTVIRVIEYLNGIKQNSW